MFFLLRPENLWVPRGFWRLVWPVLPYENRDAEVPEQGCLCHSEIQSATAAAADSAELSTASGGRRSRRTPDRRGGQLVSVAQFVCQTPTNSPEEPEIEGDGGAVATAATSPGTGIEAGLSSVEALAGDVCREAFLRGRSISSPTTNSQMSLHDLAGDDLSSHVSPTTSTNCLSVESWGGTRPEQNRPLRAAFSPLTRAASVHTVPGPQPEFV